MVHEIQDIVEYLFEEFDGYINKDNQLEIVIDSTRELNFIYDSVLEEFEEIFDHHPDLLDEWENYWEYKDVVEYVDNELTIIFPPL